MVGIGMRIRKVVWKIVAGALALILFGAGAIPATTNCADGCACYRQSGHRFHVSPDHSITQPADSMPVLPVFHTPTHPAKKAPEHHPVCQARRAETCRVQLYHPTGVVQRSVMAVVQKERLTDCISGTAVAEAIIEGDPFFDPSIRKMQSVDASSVPLYLKHLSIIC
jgi:hypothetical protein